MLECVIPECCAQEKLLRSGALHLVDVIRDNGSSSKKMIFYARNVSLKYTVQTWRAPGEQIRLRERVSTRSEVAAMFMSRSFRRRKPSISTA
jgi:hypothetical protein